MTIGLFFGTFDPIHIGHIQVARNLIVNKTVSQVWFVVTPSNPFKKDQKITSKKHRIAMVYLAIKDYAFFKASNLEFKLSSPQYTANTLRYLQENYNHHTFSVVMGADNYANITDWKDYQYILKNFKICVYKRNPYQMPTSPDIIKMPGDYINVSSSHIRQNINSLDSKFLHKDVCKYAITHNLYI